MIPQICLQEPGEDKIKLLGLKRFVKSYIMPIRGTVAKNNLSIIAKGYDLVIWKSYKFIYEHIRAYEIENIS